MVFGRFKLGNVWRTGKGPAIRGCQRPGGWIRLIGNESQHNVGRRRRILTATAIVSVFGLVGTSLLLLNDGDGETSGNATPPNAAEEMETIIRNWRVLKTVMLIVADYSLSSAYNNSKVKEALIINPINSSPDLSKMEEEELDRKSKTHQRCADRLLKLFKQNGGGQHISSLTYLLPVEYTETMIPLQDMCPLSSIASLDRVFRSETGGISLNEVFEEFDPVPLGSASLAQVHRGKLRKTGEVVAVKIQHEGLDAHARGDIRTCARLAKVVERIWPSFEFGWLVTEMAENLPRELDFRVEAANGERCKKMFAKDGYRGIYIPRIVKAERRILIMEFIDGERIDNLSYLKKVGIEGERISKRVADITGRMIFRYRFLHADCHFGNLLVQFKPTYLDKLGLSPSLQGYLPSFLKPENFQITLLDHGLYRELSRSFVDNYARFWLSLIGGDEAGVSRFCFKMFHEKDGVTIQREGGNEQLIGKEEGTSSSATSSFTDEDIGKIEYHRLFASILSGRSWETLSSSKNSTSGLVDGFTTPRSDKEQRMVQGKAGTRKFLEAISLILRRCPRELLLVLKNNDLVRVIDVKLSSELGQEETSLSGEEDERRIKRRQKKLARHMLLMIKDFGWICLLHTVFPYTMPSTATDATVVSFASTPPPKTHWLRDLYDFGSVGLKLLLLEVFIH